ncbi:MAG: hypothetical protein V4556_00045 [Bacteroidota bacterium]
MENIKKEHSRNLEVNSSENKQDTPHFPYYFTEKYFEYNGMPHRVVLTPELYPEDDGLDFTGKYYGILIGNRGTRAFEIVPDDFITWVEEGRDLELAEIISTIIKKDILKLEC